MKPAADQRRVKRDRDRLQLSHQVFFPTGERVERHPSGGWRPSAIVPAGRVVEQSSGEDVALFGQDRHGTLLAQTPFFWGTGPQFSR
jgi:hypothetical protein